MMGDVVQSSIGRISYDAEEASIVAAFSEDSVRRGFIKKVEKFRRRSLKDTLYLIILPGVLHTFCSTPGHLWHSGTLQPKLRSSKPISGAGK